MEWVLHNIPKIKDIDKLIRVYKNNKCSGNLISRAFIIEKK